MSRSKRLEKHSRNRYRYRNRYRASGVKGRLRLSIAIPIPMPIPNAHVFLHQKEFNAQDQTLLRLILMYSRISRTLTASPAEPVDLPSDSRFKIRDQKPISIKDPALLMRFSISNFESRINPSSMGAAPWCRPGAFPALVPLAAGDHARVL